MTTVLLTLAALILALAPLVFVHELGHFLVAKAFRIGVPVFSLGFGPRLFGIRRGGTDYRISAVPLGGYVRLAGDEADENRSGAPDEFLSRPKWQRFLVFVAGAAFNILTAFLVMWMLFAIYGKDELPGYPTVAEVVEASGAATSGIEAGDTIVEIAGRDVGDPDRLADALLMEIALKPNQTQELVVERAGERREIRLEIGSAEDGSGDPGWSLFYGGPTMIQQVAAGDRAEKAGLKAGDTIRAAGGRRDINFIEFRLLLLASPEEPLDVEVERSDGELVQLTLTPRIEEIDGKQKGKIGALLGLAEPVHTDLTLGQAAVESVEWNIRMSKALFVVLKGLISRKLPLSTVSGPVGIADYARKALASGIRDFVYFLGFLSLQLGILNLLPIPVLDGGHIVILLVEGVSRRELSEKVKERVLQIGFVFLMIMMSLIIIKDLVQFTR